ncbi:hypothetical protein BKE38_06580 [Pseudoroseomonas deserti]|uniref:Uncharacterized protein n=1 Tax=Teichococcus deserti TaxID=1817963 RepID=A0A1V2H5D5_9PROT|nr:hypothetical protein [Pseudoroseomonas deserti]ONG56167.1 hypothetical protein BKE38_06580 [Pseudoroseomonas deserti]
MAPDAPWQIATGDHLLRFQPGGRVLQVTFDHLKPHRGRDGQPEPWGWRFAIQNGWSILGIASLRPVWFREPALHDALLRLRDAGFFRGFDRVVFAGSSKGGFGALVFSSLSPGATVIAIDPQSTLDRALVPWETRYPLGDWALPFRDAAEELAVAARIWLLHDPHFAPDRRHADRLSAPGLTLLRCRHLGHGLAESLQKMDILAPVMRGFTEGILDEAGFWALYRARRRLVRYPRALFAHALARGHFRLAERMARALAEQREDGHWFLARAALFEAAAGDQAAFLRGLALMQRADR